MKQRPIGNVLRLAETAAHHPVSIQAAAACAAVIGTVYQTSAKMRKFYNIVHLVSGLLLLSAAVGGAALLHRQKGTGA